MASELILIVAVIFFVIVLIIFSNVQTRITKLQMQIQALQKRMDQHPLNETAPISEPQQSKPVDIVPSIETPTQQAPVSTPHAAEPMNKESIQKTITQNMPAQPASRFKPITPEQRAQNQAKQATKQIKEQNDENSLGSSFLRWLINGNPVAKVAIVILFFGLSYLLKYSIDNGLLSPEIRILGSLLLGVALLIIGWKLRKKKELYALILQGGAIGVLYFTLFAAFKLYALVPLLLTFALLIIVCATSVMFAVLQRAISLAIVACVGGYLAPILLSTGSGNHIALFSYYLLISSAILVISFWQSWRALNLIGFTFTFIVAMIWGGNNFREDYYIECQLFILANMLVYGVLAVLLSIRNRKTETYQNAFDLILLFSVPLIAFCLQYAITEHWEFAPAFSALGFGLFYLVGSFIVLRIWRSEAKQLALYGLAIGLGFSTLAVPLALSASWTALVWLFEGTAITCVALNQRQCKLAWIGALVVLLGTISALVAGQTVLSDITFITLYGVMSGILLFNACLWHHHRQLDPTSEPVKYLFIFIAVITWSAWIMGSVYRLSNDITYAIQPIIACYVIAVWIWFAIGRKINWSILRFAVIALWPILLLSLVYNCSFHLHTYNAGIWGISWLIAFASSYCYLHVDRQNIMSYKQLSPILHISLLWIVLAWLFYEVSNLLSFLPWGFAAVKWSIMVTVASIIILVFFVLQKYRLFPMLELKPLYWKIGLSPIALYLILNLFIGLYSSGQIIYWEYIPLLNPLEEAAALGIMTLILWFNNVLKLIPSNNQSTSALPLSTYVLILMIVLVFLWGNSLILRSLSQWFDISWSFYALWHNNIVQIVLSLVWTLASVILVAIANHFSLRKTWFAGAALQTIVVAKLVLVDSIELDGLMRAFVFIGVALLMLVIGYLAPLPPKITSNKPEQSGKNTDIPVTSEPNS